MIRSTCAALLLAASAAAAQVAEPQDYRDGDYRSPVPETLAGATVVDDEAAHALWTSGDVLFVDVLPKPPKPANLPEGTIWREQTRRNIPGSIWLPNVGYGRIHETTDAYFKDNLTEAVDGDLSHPVLIYCLEDCWMSWNAAKRAQEYGFTTVYWYPLGTDGWAFQDYPTEKSLPAE